MFRPPFSVDTRRQLEKLAAENALLHQENVEMRRQMESMWCTLMCSQIVEGHSHLQEKCKELSEELRHVKRISENIEKSDENKTERVRILQLRLQELEGNLGSKNALIEIIHEQLAELFQRVRVESDGAQQLKEEKKLLEHQLSNAQEENNALLKELFGFLDQVRELKETTNVLRDELEVERNIRKDVVRRSSSKKGTERPLSVPVFSLDS